MIPVRQKLSDYQSADEAIADLSSGLLPDEARTRSWQVVPAGDLPDPFNKLLDHREHMTTRLADFHGLPVSLQVQQHAEDGDVYRRRIILTPTGSDFVVEFGLVRIDLAFTAPAVRAAILKRSQPLGDVLIKHNVLRRIHPRWFLRFRGDSPLLVGSGLESHEELYGRIGTIYCDEQPAIELLEIVTDQRHNQQCSVPSTDH